MSRNDFLDYYGENEIDTSLQNIDDIELHYSRRRKLYIQLGMPPLTFQNKRILEIGCGSGTNGLAYIHMGGCCDFVEANPTGINNLYSLYNSLNIDKAKYNAYLSKIEDFASGKDYDIVIAELFLNSLDSVVQKIIIDKMKELTVSNGICVVSCADFVGIYVETIKRIIGIVMSEGIGEFKEKVEFLTKVFEPQTRTLRGMSRTTEEWVEDVILNPSWTNGNQMTMADAINMFEDSFDILGTSPNMFTDYSWYKDVWFDQKEDCLTQFKRKRLNFLLAGTSEYIIDIEESDRLVRLFENIYHLISKYEHTGEKRIFKDIKTVAKEIELSIELFPIQFREVFLDTEMVFEDILNDSLQIDKYKALFSAFGRAVQYISFVKR